MEKFGKIPSIGNPNLKNKKPDDPIEEIKFKRWIEELNKDLEDFWNSI